MSVNHFYKNLLILFLFSAVSTLIGVVVLSISDSKLFRLFFKMMFSIIMLGIVHGMIILPVILTCKFINFFLKINSLGSFFRGIGKADI